LWSEQSRYIVIARTDTSTKDSTMHKYQFATGGPDALGPIPFEAHLREHRELKARLLHLAGHVSDDPDDRSSRRGRGGRGPGGRSRGGPWVEGADDFGPPPWARGRGRGRGPRARRGDVRAALLALLAEEPRHGYQLMQELSQRTNGMWQPSPGSVYPALSLLEDEGLIVAVEADGKRVFTITDAGRAEVEARSGPKPWEQVNDDVDDVEVDLGRLAFQVMAAVKQLRHAGTGRQHEAAVKLLTETKRGIYRILAEDDLDETPPAE